MFGRGGNEKKSSNSSSRRQKDDADRRAIMYAEILDAVTESSKKSRSSSSSRSVAKTKANGRVAKATFRSVTRDNPNKSVVGGGKEAAGLERFGGNDEEGDIDTVQVVKVRFQIHLEVGFGDIVRICGSHEAMGGWDVANAMLLEWSEGNVWTSEEIELPVDGIYIYKYCIAPASNPNAPTSWQIGNNTVLSLSPEDGPILYVKDSWSGNPNESAVFSTEGVKMSKDDRLVERVRKADDTVKRQTGEIKELRTELKLSKMQVKALREEARLSANVRIALKEQLKAEKKRNLVFEEQISAWKKRFMSLTGQSEKSDKNSR